MLNIILTIFATALSLLVVDIIFPSVSLDTFLSAIVGATVLGGVNAFIRPVLGLLSFPLTVLSLGGFALIVNGFCFWLAAFLVPGFKVSGFLAFILGPVILSAVSTFFNHYLAEKLPQFSSESLTTSETD